MTTASAKSRKLRNTQRMSLCEGKRGLLLDVDSGMPDFCSVDCHLARCEKDFPPAFDDRIGAFSKEYKTQAPALMECQLKNLR